MELPRRPKGDEYTKPGRYQELQARVRRGVAGKDVPVLFVYAFDRRTRLGPYVFVDKKLVPGAPLAVASALAAAGFENSRVVLQQWNPHIRPSQARIGGKPPELLLVSSMQIHSASAYRLIDDAYKLGENRPLILAGGAKAIYEPCVLPDPRLQPGHLPLPQSRTAGRGDRRNCRENGHRQL